MVTKRLVVFVLVVLAWVSAGQGQVQEQAQWPRRVALREAEGRTGLIRELPSVRGLSGARVGLQLRPQPADREDAAALRDRLEVEREIEFEGPGAFVFRTLGAAATEEEGEKPAVEYFVFVSGEQREEGPVRLQRTWFAYHAARGESLRGVALLMPGMFGTPEPILDLFTRELAGHGWAVVRMMSQPSRFTERVVFEVDLLNPLHSVTAVAAEMTTRVAEAAYSAEAAMEHVVGKHPELAEKPRIAVGMSGGAMILPTVLARERDRYAAAVAIAGGANFFAMSDESNYKFLIGAVDFRWLPQEPTEEERERTYALYLRHAPLDAFNTAVTIVGMPLLLIHASFDAAVPAKLGDQLWEQLGRPERWVHEAGHEELFMKLPGQMEEILKWIDGAVLKEGQKPGEAAEQGR